MIAFADTRTQDDVRRMWKTVFGDSDAYMDIYFGEKYRNQNTLIYFDEGKAAASLQMLPYDFSFCGTEIPVAYFSGLCTMPEARKKGFMAALIRRAFQEMATQSIPLALLVPQETWLLDFYGKFGFAQTFDAGTETLPPLKPLVEKYPNDLAAAYREFDAYFRHRDMTVQKSFGDFRAIVAEAALFDFPSKHNLTGMARVTDVQRLLSVFAAAYPQKRFSVAVRDEILPQNNAVFSVENGAAHRETLWRIEPFFDISINQLTEFLLGYHTSEKQKPIAEIFPEKQAGINFMLE